MQRLSLSPVKVAQTLGDFGTGDVQTTRGPLWFLTNDLCENTGYWHTDVFDYHNVAYQGATETESYPLTRAEAQFIQPDGIDLPGYATEMLLGSSVWWQNQKWFCPTLEFCYQPDVSTNKHHGLTFEEADFLSRKDCLRAFVESEAERLGERLRSLLGEVLLDLDGLPDRFVLHLLVPVTVVQARFHTLQEWQEFLGSLFLVTADPVLVYLDLNCEQDRGGPEELTNTIGKSFGCAVYDVTHAPDFPADDPDTFSDWLYTQDSCLKVWARSPEAARHNARLACDECNFIPVHPFTRRYLPREIHLLDR